MKKKQHADPDHATIMICAIRYALGRQTYMPGIVQDYIRRHKEDLDTNAIVVMITDIEEADKITKHEMPNGKVLEIDGLGDTKIDRPGWLALLKWLKELEAERLKELEARIERNGSNGSK